MEMETRITKNGNSFGFAIPKGFIDCKTLEFGKRYKLLIQLLDEDERISGVWTRPSDLVGVEA